MKTSTRSKESTLVVLNKSTSTRNVTNINLENFRRNFEAYVDEIDITNLNEYINILLSLIIFLLDLMSFFTFFQFEFVPWLKCAGMYQTVLILKPKYKEQ